MNFLRFTRNRRKRAERMRKIAVETRAKRYTSKPRARVESPFSLRYKSAERTGTTHLMACVCQSRGKMHLHSHSLKLQLLREAASTVALAVTAKREGERERERGKSSDDSHTVIYQRPSSSRASSSSSFSSRTTMQLPYCLLLQLLLQH